MTNASIALVSANVSITRYDQSMSLFLYFFSSPIWSNELVVRTVEFKANTVPATVPAYDPSSLDFSNAIVTDGYPNYNILTGTNLNWSQPTNTYYAIWSQFNSQLQTGGNPNLSMVISNTPISPGPIPTYSGSHWYWAGTITANI